MNRHPYTNVSYRQGKPHAVFDLPCKAGEMRIGKYILVIWELGLRER